MVLKATVFKAELQVADMDRGYYGSHSVTLARHPSETDERMMVRLLAFALHAHEHLAFGRGLSSDDEPDIWRKDLTGAIDLWIDVGLPDERRIRRACGRAREVVVYSYGGRAAELWWNQAEGDFARNANLTVRSIPYDGSRSLAALATRNMALQFTIQEAQVWVADDHDGIQLDVATRMEPGEQRR